MSEIQMPYNVRVKFLLSAALRKEAALLKKTFRVNISLRVKKPSA